MTGLVHLFFSFWENVSQNTPVWITTAGLIFFPVNGKKKKKKTNKTQLIQLAAHWKSAFPWVSYFGLLCVWFPLGYTQYFKNMATKVLRFGKIKFYFLVEDIFKWNWFCFLFFFLPYLLCNVEYDSYLKLPAVLFSVAFIPLVQISAQWKRPKND